MAEALADLLADLGVGEFESAQETVEAADEPCLPLADIQTCVRNPPPSHMSRHCRLASGERHLVGRLTNQFLGYYWAGTRTASSGSWDRQVGRQGEPPRVG